MKTKSKIIQVVFSLCVATLTLGFGSADGIEIRPTLIADTYVDRDEPDDNFGSENRLDCHYGITGANPDGSRHYLIRQVLLRFDDTDLSSIPATDVINRATLRTYLDSAYGNSHVYVELGIINTDWDEDTVTWNSLGQRILYPRSPRITIHVGETPGWFEWDVTPIVSNWHSGVHTNYGISMDIYLEAGTPIEDYSRMFYSKEGSAARAPELIVDYTATFPPTDVDLSVTKYEITQAIQYLDDPTEPDNSVPMIAHKPTIIRFYVDIGAAAGPVFNVSGRLYKREGGVEESIAPLNPIVAVAAPDRGDHHQTLNFRPPVEWLQGSWSFYLVLNPDEAVRENDYTNNRFPAAAETYEPVTFEADDRELDIAWLKVHYTWSGWTGPAWAGDRVGTPATVNFLRAVYPIAPQRVNYFPWPGGSLGDWDSDIDTNSSSLLSAIDDLLTTSTLDPKPDLLYGWVPDNAFPSGKGLGYKPGNTAFGEDNSLPNMLHRIIFTHEHGHNMAQDGHGSLPDASLSGGEYGYDPMDVDLAGRVVMRTYTDAGGVTRDLIDFMRGGGPAPGILDGNHAWVTPYTYVDIHNEMTTRGFVTDGPAAPFAGETLYVSGIIDKEGKGALHPIYRFTTHPPDQPSDGSYAIEVLDEKGNRLYWHPFDIHFYIDYMGIPVTRVPFSFFIPYYPDMRKIILWRGSTDYDSKAASAHAPEVKMVFPNGGEKLKGVQKIAWDGRDGDNDPLTYMLLYSTDDGTTWRTVASRLKNEIHVVDLDELPGSEKARFRVMASDGLLSATDDSDGPFGVSPKNPQAFIIHPDKELVFAPDYPMLFVGQGYDPEDGSIGPAGLSWESDRDGFLGIGNTLETRLSVGIHTVTLRAYDQQGHEGSDTIIVHNLKGTVYLDKDGDGYGDPNATMVVFDVPEGYSAWPGDCNDGDPGVNPDAPDDVVDGVDNNCNGFVDEGASKWLQVPDMRYGLNVRSETVEPLVADDWLCIDGESVTEVHFWGSYLDALGYHWQQENPGPPSSQLPPTPGIKGFKIGIYEDMADTPYHHPGMLLQEYAIGQDKIKEIYWGSVSHVGPNQMFWWEHKFYYIIRLEPPFPQKVEKTYWLSIGAATNDPKQEWDWGWETSQDHWNANACLYWAANNYWAEIVPGSWPIPDGYPYNFVDMAFMLLTKGAACRADIDDDGDVDGKDLKAFGDGGTGLTMEAVAAEFGRVDCF